VDILDQRRKIEMKVLLINPWVYDFASFDLWAKPLGLLYIADALKKCGCETELIDCLDRNYPGIENKKTDNFGCGKYYKEEVEKPLVLKDVPRKYKRYGIPLSLFEKALENKEPDVILITSVMTYWYPGVFKAIEILKKKFPSVPILLGGTYATLCSEHAKKFSGAEIFAGWDIEKIVGRVFELAGKSKPEKINALKLRPDYSFYKELDYAVLRTSWGCPFKCSYCAIGKLSDKFVKRSPEDVINEIAFLYDNKDVMNFAFYDDALLFDFDTHLAMILEGIIKKGVKASFHTPNGLHARFIKKNTADLLRKANFIEPRLSLETSDLKRQKITGSKVFNEEFETAVKNLFDASYKKNEISAYIMMGMPQQDFDEVKNSIKYASDLGIKVFLVEYSPIPGTEDWQKYKFDFKDPLLHNNSIFPLYGVEDWDRFQELKDLVRRYRVQGTECRVNKI